MFAQERQQLIADMVNTEGSVRVKELSERFSVTEDCIRKDLTLLEKEGLIRKIYGGAVKVRVNIHDFQVSQRIDKNLEVKQAIAKKAFERIGEGDMVFLDISTVNIELAKLLARSEKLVYVVTNMIEAMLELTRSVRAEVIFTGGHFSRSYGGFVGATAIEVIERFRFDLAFIGVVGVNLAENAVTTYEMEDGVTKSAVMRVSRKNYMLLETRKFHEDGNYRFSTVEDFDGAVMEGELSADVQKQMKDYEIDWIR